MRRIAKQWSPISLIILVGLFVLGTTSSRAQGVINVSACQTINQSGSYQLTTDISGGSWCITIRTGNVTFDGNGHSITSSTGDPLEVSDFSNNEDGFSNVTLRNFTSTGGIRLFGNNISNVLIENLNVEGISVLGSDDVTIQNNTVGQGGVQINNADRAVWAPLRPVVTGNTVTGGSTNVKILFEIAGGANHPCPRVDARVENNTITDTRSDPPPEATAAVRIRCATHTIFRNNTIRSTATTIGLYMRDESDYGLYENNSFWTHSQEALRIASGNLDKTMPAYNVFRNNTFRSDTVAVMYLQGVGLHNIIQNNIIWGASGGLSTVSGAVGTVFDHNTFYVTSTGTMTTLTYRQGPPPDSWTNNIFSYSGGSLFGYDGWVVNPYTGDRNLFQNRAGSVSFGGRGGSLSAWRTSSGGDANSIEANPLFTDPANGDFTLQAGSPARGLGTNGSDVGARPFQAPACTEHWTCADWSTCSGGQQTRVCIDDNQCGTTSYRPIQAQSCDATVPTVSVTSPAQGATVSGTVTVTASGSDNYYLGGIQFQIDGVDHTYDTSAPYSASWNTALLADGTHTISATANDAAWNENTTSIQVLVQNGPACVEDWVSIPCSGWSACVNNTQTRTCTDANNCGTTTTRPPLSQSCVVQCVESWTCDPWSACSGGQQIRSCTDSQGCGTTANRPALSQSCVMPETPDTTSPASIGNLQAS